MTVAVIDLGSNTFHLLIVSIENFDQKNMKVVHRSVYFTKLAGGGGGLIPPKIYEGACEALITIREKLDLYEPDFVRVVGTAVMRTAINSQSFREDAKKILGYTIEILDGDTEAYYVAKGSLVHTKLQSGNHLIMDIGGGSTEFIFLSQGSILWKHSTPLGVGVLQHQFFQKEIFSENNLQKAKEHVLSNLPFSANDFKNIPCHQIGGASGTFEAMEFLLFHSSDYGDEVRQFEGSKCTDLFHKISGLTYEERLQIPHMPAKRADLIPVGLWLVKIVMESVNCHSLFVSRFAIKEGVIASVLTNSRNENKS